MSMRIVNYGIREAAGTVAPFNPAFVITIDTRKTGVTNSNSFRLPLVSGLSYNFNVDWGDGNIETVAGSAIASTNHVYLSGGVYTVTITGTFPRIYFNNGGDKLKLLTIENLGAVGWTSFSRAFYGCSNNTKCGGDVDWGTVTDCSYAWRSNSLTSWTVALPSSLTNCTGAWSSSLLTSWTVALPSSLTNCTGAWAENQLTSWTVDLPASLTNCANAWSSNPLTSWTVALPSSLTNCASAWSSNLLTSWTAALPSSLTNCTGAWAENQLTSWTVALPSSLTYCTGAWANNLITSWTGGGWAGVIDATTALQGGNNAINTTDYNALLVAIEANNQNDYVTFDFGGSKHSGSGTIARAALIADHGDTITDGGAA